MSFLKPDAPAMPPPPPAPPGSNLEDPSVKKNLENAASAERKARGRASTILTGPLGVSGEAPSARRTLLGS